MKLRPSNARGTTEIDWLISRHTFSFGEYIDRGHHGYRTLRVINDDIIAPSSGFGMHGHRDMEIITIVLSGELEHQDSLGHRGALRPGEVQVMSAGSGIRHSEYNPSATTPLHLIQIWILPRSHGIAPRYEQRTFANELRRNTWCEVAASDQSVSSAIAIHQDASVLLSDLDANEKVGYQLAPGRACWLHVATGEVEVNGTQLTAGDAVSLEGPATVQCTGVAETSTLILFDLS